MTPHEIVEKFESAVKEHRIFASEIVPYRDRFHAFLLEHPDISFWWTCSIEEDLAENDEPTTAYAFDLDLTNTADGVCFSTEVEDDGYFSGFKSLWFAIPVSYIEDPDKWETEEIAAAETRRILVEKTYDRIAPGVREELGLIINIVSRRHSRIIAAALLVKDEEGKETSVFGSKNMEKIGVYRFSVDPATGDVVELLRPEDL